MKIARDKQVEKKIGNLNVITWLAGFAIRQLRIFDDFVELLQVNGCLIQKLFS